MRKSAKPGRPLGIIALLLRALGASSTAARANPSDPTLAATHDDPALNRAACPPFMPKSCSIAILHGDPAPPERLHDGFCAGDLSCVLPIAFRAPRDAVRQIAEAMTHGAGGSQAGPISRPAA